MKKTLSFFGLIICGSLFSQNIPFDKLYSNTDPVNYYLGHYPVSGSDGLDINWYGGIRLRTSGGIGFQLTDSGNVGIGTVTPKAKFDVQNRILVDEGGPVFGVALRAYDTYWARGYNFLDASGLNNLGGFGGVGDNTKVDSYFIGKEYNNAVVNFYPLDKKSIFSGNVGVGTNYPSGKLHVGDDTSAGVIIDNRLTGVTPKIPAQIFWAESGFSTLAGDLILAPRTDISTSIIFYTNNGSSIGERLRIAGNGNASLQGKFEAKEIKVTLTPTADFVFEKDYDLPKLEDVEKHIMENKHLPEISSAKVMEKEGVNVGEFQIKLLQKIEELTLYSIEQNKQIKNLQKENETLKQQSEKIETLEKKLEQLLSVKK